MLRKFLIASVALNLLLIIGLVYAHVLVGLDSEWFWVGMMHWFLGGASVVGLVGQ